MKYTRVAHAAITLKSKKVAAGAWMIPGRSAPAPRCCIGSMMFPALEPYQKFRSGLDHTLGAYSNIENTMSYDM